MSSFKSVIPSESEESLRKNRNRPEGDGAQPVFLPDLKRFFVASLLRMTKP
jgi:hypothetical protein